MSLNPEKLTVKSREAVQRAHSLAEESGHPQLVPLHLLKSLLDEVDGIPRAILQKIGVNVQQLQSMGV